MSEPILIV